MKKFEKVWIYIFLVLFALVPIISIDKSIFFSILFFLLILFFIKKIKIKKFPLFLFLVSLFARIVICLTIDTQPVSDFAVLLNAARSINLGDYTFNNSVYFGTWAYQIGFTFFQSLLLKIVDNILIIKIFDCFITAGICLLIYYISREFMREKIARIVSIIYSFMIFPLTYVTVITNQHLSSFLIYLAIFILITDKLKIKETYKYIIVGILISFGNIIRPEGIITIMAIIIYLLVTIKKDTIKNVIKNIIALLFSYYIIFFVCSSLFILSGIGPNGLKNNAPYWKFVLGFNHETAGGYCEADTYVIGNKEYAYDLIKKRISVNPVKTGILFVKKINNFWNKSTLDWTFSDYYKNNNTKIIISKLNNYNEKCVFIMYILMIIGIFNYIKKKNWNKKIILLINQVFITFGVYLLIEIQPRYAYFIQISTVILMGFGIEYLSIKLNSKKNL